MGTIVAIARFPDGRLGVLDWRRSFRGVEDASWLAPNDLAPLPAMAWTAVLGGMHRPLGHWDRRAEPQAGPVALIVGPSSSGSRFRPPAMPLVGVLAAMGLHMTLARRATKG